MPLNVAAVKFNQLATARTRQNFIAALQEQPAPDHLTERVQTVLAKLHTADGKTSTRKHIQWELKSLAADLLP